MSENKIETESTVPLNDIQARREARRRRILENAKDRLEKLSGNAPAKDGHINTTTYQTFSDPEVETEEKYGPKCPIITPESSSLFENSFQQNKDLGNDENLFKLFNQISQHQSTSNSDDFSSLLTNTNNINNKQPETKIGAFLKTKLHLVVISCLTYILFATGNEYFASFTVFLPLLLWEITEALLLHTFEKQENLLFNIAFMMVGISPPVSKVLLKTIGTLNKIFEDVGVFIFFFVFCQLVCSF